MSAPVVSLDAPAEQAKAHIRNLMRDDPRKAIELVADCAHQVGLNWLQSLMYAVTATYDAARFDK